MHTKILINEHQLLETIKKSIDMDIGTVKWFNNAKGYGFILPEGGGEDLFAHYSSIATDGYKILKAGQLVAYETIQGAKGLHATNIQTIAEDQLQDIKAQSANKASANHSETAVTADITIR